MFSAMLFVALAADEIQVVTRENLDNWLRAEGRIIGIQQAQQRVQTAIAVLTNAKTQRPTAEQWKRMRDELADAKADAKNPKPAWPTMFADNLQLKQIGALRRRINIGQDDVEAQQYRVKQVVDGENMLIEMEFATKGKFDPLWLQMPTNGKVDDRTYLIGDEPFEVIATKRYGTTLGGSNTVFVLKTFQRTTEKR